MEASLTGTGGISPVSSPPATGIATGNGTAPLLYENDPSFSFIPVTDQTNAQVLLQPIPENVFYSLYMQGFRVDQLFRLMVDRIEVTLPPDPTSTTDKGCDIEVIRNVPPPAVDGPEFSRSARDFDRYVVFLRLSALAYALQLHGLLQVRGAYIFEPIDLDSFIRNDAGEGNGENHNQKTGTDGNQPSGGHPPANGNTPSPDDVTVVVESQGGGGGGAAGKNPQLPTAKEFNDAAAKGEAWELQGADPFGSGGVWVLGQKILEPQFQLNKMAPDAGAQPDRVYGQNVSSIENLLRNELLPNDPSVSQLTQSPELTDFLEILFSGFGAGGSSGTGTGPCTSQGASKHGVVTSRLVLRSLIGVMAAAAQEQTFYDAMAESGLDPYVHMERDDLIQSIHRGLQSSQGLLPQQEDPAYLARVRSVSGTELKFSDLVPPLERLPILRLTWPSYVKPPVAHSSAYAKEYGLGLSYKGRDYVVADVEPDAVNPNEFSKENETWNRDVFRLINELSSQVSVDISKFPLPDILQLRTE